MRDVPQGLRDRKRRRTRRAIERAALDLFARQGFHDTTIPQIAEAADVSPRTVSAYFPHKEELAFPDPEEEFRHLEARLNDRSPGQGATDALREWIRSVLDEDDERAAERRVRRRVVRADESLRAYEHRFMLRAQEVSARAIAEDLGVPPTALEPRMAAAATLTVFEVLGEDEARATAADADTAGEALERVDRALEFIGGGIRALRDASRAAPPP
jgi:AcrR family transcriptional regulator